MPMQSFFAERFFARFDRDGDGTVDKDELVAGVRILTSSGNTRDKLKLLFDIYDIDGMPINNYAINCICSITS